MNEAGADLFAHASWSVCIRLLRENVMKMMRGESGDLLLLPWPWSARVKSASNEQSAPQIDRAEPVRVPLGATPPETALPFLLPMVRIAHCASARQHRFPFWNTVHSKDRGPGHRNSM